MKFEFSTSPVADLGGGAPGARPLPLRPKIFSISCSFSQNLAKSYVGVPPPGGLAPPPTGNPGSAPDLEYPTYEPWAHYTKNIPLDEP